MPASGFNKTGWHWTRKGWKRSPKRLQTVKKVPKATKRRPFKKVPIQAAEREKPPTFAEVRKLAAEQGRAQAAPPRAGGREASPAPSAAGLEGSSPTTPSAVRAFFG